jgi:hypothetical protein
VRRGCEGFGGREDVERLLGCSWVRCEEKKEELEREDEEKEGRLTKWEEQGQTFQRPSPEVPRGESLDFSCREGPEVPQRSWGREEERIRATSDESCRKKEKEDRPG